jgi:hypothetical protein
MRSLESRRAAVWVCSEQRVCVCVCVCDLLLTTYRQCRWILSAPKYISQAAGFHIFRVRMCHRSEDRLCRCTIDLPIRAIGTGFLVSMDMHVCMYSTYYPPACPRPSITYTALVPTSTVMHDRFDIGEIDE